LCQIPFLLPPRFNTLGRAPTLAPGITGNTACWLPARLQTAGVVAGWRGGVRGGSAHRLPSSASGSITWRLRGQRRPAHVGARWFGRASWCGFASSPVLGIPGGISPQGIRKRSSSLPIAAAYLNVSTSTLYGWVWQRRIAFVKVGRALRFDKSDLKNFVQSHRFEARPTTKFGTNKPRVA
jgi:excisionase family DNA binding protein